MDYGATNKSEVPPSPSGEEGMEHESETLTVPASMLPGGMDANPGDILEFKVIGKEPDGGIQVEYNRDGGEKGEAPWKTDLKNSMAAQGSPGGEGEM